MKHLQKCDEDLHDPNFNIDQQLLQNSLELVDKELRTKAVLRNASAMRVENRNKLEQ